METGRFFKLTVVNEFYVNQYLSVAGERPRRVTVHWSTRFGPLNAFLSISKAHPTRRQS